MPNLKALLEALLRSKVDFVLIGGFASVVHGATQVTQDIDICAAITDETLMTLREAPTSRSWSALESGAARTAFGTCKNLEKHF